MTVTPRRHRSTVRLVTDSQEELYSAQRQFDIVTLLTITSAYALLFTIMRLLQWRTDAFFLVAVFFTLVGIGQAFLFGGEAPRAASVVVGSIYWAVVGGGYAAMLAAAGPLGGGEQVFFLLCMMVSLGFQGILAGYVGGVLIGGVFMVAEVLRSCLRPLRGREEEENGAISAWENRDDSPPVSVDDDR